MIFLSLYKVCWHVSVEAYVFVHFRQKKQLFWSEYAGRKLNSREPREPRGCHILLSHAHQYAKLTSGEKARAGIYCHVFAGFLK